MRWPVGCATLIGCSCLTLSSALTDPLARAALFEQLRAHQVHLSMLINVASLAAFSPMPVKATYAASKRFLLDFSLALREELRGLGATVTVLCPAGMPMTPETIEGIEMQGLIGHITTQNIGSVAAGALDAALRGRAVYIPGLFNRILQGLSALIPAQMAASLLGARWMAAYHKRVAYPAAAASAHP